MLLVCVLALLLLMLQVMLLLLLVLLLPLVVVLFWLSFLSHFYRSNNQTSKTNKIVGSTKCCDSLFPGESTRWSNNGHGPAMLHLHHSTTGFSEVAPGRCGVHHDPTVTQGMGGPRGRRSPSVINTEQSLTFNDSLMNPKVIRRFTNKIVLGHYNISPAF